MHTSVFAVCTQLTVVATEASITDTRKAITVTCSIDAFEKTSFAPLSRKGIWTHAGSVVAVAFILAIHVAFRAVYVGPDGKAVTDVISTCAALAK